MVWTIGVRRPWEREYEILEMEYPTRDDAERDLLQFVIWEAEKRGVRLESAVYCDGLLDHEHGAPKKWTVDN